jgi:hypothetical protein
MSSHSGERSTSLLNPSVGLHPLGGAGADLGALPKGFIIGDSLEFTDINTM